MRAYRALRSSRVLSSWFMRNLFSELRRRNVLRIAAAYALAAWIVIEAGSVLLPTFGGSERLFRLYVIVVIAGFVVAVALSWLFEWTPEGVKLDRNVPRDAPVRRRSGSRLNYTIIALLAAALTVSLIFNVKDLPRAGLETGSPPRSLAVLPFESRSSDPDNALFADGIHDDLLTRLANIRTLKVISRTSVMEYRNTTKNLRTIGEELGVEAVLEGTVQRIGERVRINLQLIDAATDEHLWAQAYDRDLTIENIFSVQAEVSGAVAAALRTQLSPEEQVRVEAAPTRDLRAYRLFKEGRQNLYSRRLEALRQARHQFEEAAALDPEYAEAHAGLAEATLLLWNNHLAIGPDEAVAATEASLDRALALDPDLADAHAILGLLKATLWESDRLGRENLEAEAAFHRALELNPNHSSAYMWFASLRNAEERLDEAIELYQRAIELDPLARIPYVNLPLIYAKRGEHRAAMQLWLEAARIHNDWPTVYEYVAVHLWGLGRLDEAFAWYRRAVEVSGNSFDSSNMDIGVLVDLGELEAALAVLDEIPPEHVIAPALDGYRALIVGDFARATMHFVDALERSEVPERILNHVASDSALLAGDLETARRYALAADPLLTRDAPDTVDRRTARGAIKLAYIHQRTGRPEKAARLLDDALEVIRNLPRLGTFGFGIRDVQIYALLGRKEDALNAFREALDEGWRGSVMFDGWPLALDPYLETIRDEPRFRAMVAELDGYVADMRDHLYEAHERDALDSLRAGAETI